MSLDSQVNQMEIPKIPKDANVLAVCVKGIKRSPILVKILQEHGYQNVDCTGSDIPDLNEVQGKMGWAKYIVTLYPTVAPRLRELGLITEQHMLIELEVNEWVSGGNGKAKTLDQIYDEIKEKIAPYLEN